MEKLASIYCMLIHLENLRELGNQLQRDSQQQIEVYFTSMKEKMETLGESEQEKPKATDMELALFYATHIENPCVAEVEPGKFENIREFYLREAKEALLKIKEPNAKRFLELKIKQYEDIE